MFKRAWDKSFITENIQSAFTKTGIQPTDGKEVIQRITRPSIIMRERSLGALKTPKSSKAIRRF